MARQATLRERNAAHFPAFETGISVEPVNSLAPFQALVKRLSQAYGPSGSEDEVREMVRDEIKGYVDQVRVDALGNLIAQRRGVGTRRKKLMLSAHLDECGIMITFLDSRGFGRFGMLGSVKPLTLLGARVRFENGSIGVIARQEKNASRTELEPDSLYLDFGSSVPGNGSVSVGDAAGFVGEFVASGDYFVGKALNNRIGCAVLLEVARQLKKSPHDLSFVFSVQHQVGARGAGAAAFAIQPDYAFVLDASAAGDTPGALENGIELGKGPTIKFQDEGALTSPGARQLLINTARELRLPHQLDVTPRAQGDSLPVQAAREGVPTGVVGLAMRYANTTSEMAHRQDAENTIKLLLGVIARVQ